MVSLRPGPAAPSKRVGPPNPLKTCRAEAETERESESESVEDCNLRSKGSEMVMNLIVGGPKCCFACAWQILIRQV